MSTRFISFEQFVQERIQYLTERGKFVYFDGKRYDPVNHFPLKEYEVWMEGYSTTGEHQKAHLVGRVKARNFAQACHKLMCQNKLAEIDRENASGSTGYKDYGRWDYDPGRLSVWGMKLHWNEEMARRAFG